MRERAVVRGTPPPPVRALRRGCAYNGCPAYVRGLYGSTPARRAATTASRRVCVPSLRIAERR